MWILFLLAGSNNGSSYSFGASAVTWKIDIIFHLVVLFWCVERIQMSHVKLWIDFRSSFEEISSR